MYPVPEGILLLLLSWATPKASEGISNLVKSNGPDRRNHQLDQNQTL